MFGFEIREYFFSVSDADYRTFTANLIPNIAKKQIIGVRVPIIRKLAKKICNNKEYYKTKMLDYREEILLYGFCIGYSDLDIDLKLDLYVDYLNYANSWETVDLVFFGVKDFAQNVNKSKIYNRLTSIFDVDKEFVSRAVIVVLLRYFLTDDYIDKVVNFVSTIYSDKYYINMALSWLIAEILARYYDIGLMLLQSEKLSKFVRNHAVQKAIESNKIDKDVKNFLTTLKI